MRFLFNSKLISFPALKKKPIVTFCNSAHRHSSTQVGTTPAPVPVLSLREEKKKILLRAGTNLISPLSMGVLARNYEKIYFRKNVVVTKNLPTIFPNNKSGAQSNTIFWLIDIFFLIRELNKTNSSLQKNKSWKKLSYLLKYGEII
jgi:hypothetical protein